METESTKYSILKKKFEAYKDALEYCLACLKHQHTMKRGIPTLIKQTENIKNRINEPPTPS